MDILHTKRTSHVEKDGTHTYYLDVISGPHTGQFVVIQTHHPIDIKALQDVDVDISEIVNETDKKHEWVAGMMYVHEEDVHIIARRRNVECQVCEITYECWVKNGMKNNCH